MNKRVLLVGLVVLTMGVMGSCKKDYVCDCHLDDPDGNHSDEEMMIEKAKESDAEEACKNFEYELENSGMYSEVDCSLK